MKREPKCSRPGLWESLVFLAHAHAFWNSVSGFNRGEKVTHRTKPKSWQKRLPHHASVSPALVSPHSEAKSGFVCPTLSLVDLAAGTQAWVEALPRTHVTSLSLGVPVFKWGQ